MFDKRKVPFVLNTFKFLKGGDKCSLFQMSVLCIFRCMIQKISINFDLERFICSQKRVYMTEGLKKWVLKKDVYFYFLF